MQTNYQGAGRQSRAHRLWLWPLGFLAGIATIVLAAQETRWLVYVISATLFCLVLVMVRNRERLLWSIFILSFQFDVYLRLLFGHAGSTGLAISLTLVVASMLVVFYLVTGRMREVAPIYWGERYSIPIAVLFATAMLSLVFSNEQFVGAVYLFDHAQYYLFFLIALNFVRTEERLNLTIALLLISLAIQSIVYYIQSALGITFTLTGSVIGAGEIPRPGGTVSTTPAGFASFILPLIFIGLAYFMYWDKLPRRLPYQTLVGLAALMGLGALVLTFTRAAWGSFVLGFAWLVVIANRRGLLSRKTVAIVISAAVILTLIFLPFMFARLEVTPIAGAYDERLRLAIVAIEVIVQNPLLGIGPGAYATQYQPYIPQELAGYWMYEVHNYYLLRAAETGVIGCLAFILLLVLGLMHGLRLSHGIRPISRILGLGMSAAIVALAFEMNWDTWTDFTYNALFWFLLGLMCAAERLEAAAAWNPRDRQSKPRASN